MVVSALIPLALAAAAEPPLPPRLAQALQLAAQESRLAEARLASVAASSGPARDRARAESARARAWGDALRAAASSAQPQDGDLVVAWSRAGAQLVRGGQAGALRAGTLLREGDELVTLDGAAEVRYHDGTALTLGPGGDLRVFQAPRAFPQQSVLSLSRGRVRWRGPPAAPGVTRLLAPRSQAQLGLGEAAFQVEPDGAGVLSVYEGSAELSARPEAGPPPSAWWDEPLR